MSKGKEEMRKHLASLSFTEKIKILEKLRRRSLALASWGSRRTISMKHDLAPEHISSKGTDKG